MTSPKLTQVQMEEKMAQILSDQGLKDKEILIAQLMQSNMPEPGICMQIWCSAIAPSVEPDLVNGHCETCGSDSVISATELVLSI